VSPGMTNFRLEPTRWTSALRGRMEHLRRERPRTALLVALPALLVLALALAGCGGSKSSASSTTTETTSSEAGITLQLAADPSGQLEFDKKALEAPAGNVTIVLTNDSSVSHDVAIKGNGVDAKSGLVSNGQTTSVSADLTPGTYTFYCTVPGHEDAGMKGTLTVK
jgi:uncharacterized cupredoxin-like copper-binding protein